MTLPIYLRSFRPELYRHADRLTAYAFVRFIIKTERERKHPVTLEQAEHIFTVLREQSHRAEEARRIALKDGDLIEAAAQAECIWITRDWQTVEWGGYLTPWHINGLQARIEKGSHRDKYHRLTPMSKALVLDHIMLTEKCDMERAEEVFQAVTRKKNDILRHHKETGTWYGCDCPVDRLPSPADMAEGSDEIRLTEKQQTLRDRYGKMEPARHDWRNIENSDRLKAIAELDGVSLHDAEKIRVLLWGCSRDPLKRAVRKDETTGFECGFLYVEPFEITDEIRYKVSNLEVCDDMATFERYVVRACGLTLSDNRRQTALQMTQEAGLWRSGQADAKRNGKSVTCTAWAGKAFWETAKHEPVKPEPVKPAETPKVEPIAVVPEPTIEELAALCRKMPEIKGYNVVQALDWIEANVSKTDSMPIFQTARRQDYIKIGAGSFYGADMPAPVERPKPPLLTKEITPEEEKAA